MQCRWKWQWLQWDVPTAHIMVILAFVLGICDAINFVNGSSKVHVADVEGIVNEVEMSLNWQCLHNVVYVILNGSWKFSRKALSSTFVGEATLV